MTDAARLHWRAIVAPALLVLVLLGGLVGAVLHASATGSDEAALQRQTALVAVAVRQGLARVRKDQEASTNWDDAVVRLRQEPLDLDWIDQNLGIWFHDFYKIDEAYVIDGRNRAVYAMRSGRRVDAAAFREIANHALPLAAELRGRIARGEEQPEGSTELTLGAYDILVIRNRPVLVSIKPIVSETGAIAQAPATERLHVSLRYVDGSFLSEIASNYGIEGADFQWVSHGPASLPLRNRAGAVIGHVNWQAFRPGAEVARRMVPVLLLVLALIGSGFVFLLTRILRSRLELEASRAQAQHLAFHDALTGLPNRARFEDRLDLALAGVRRGNHVAVALLDLDRFKHVNDTLGHLAGDALIREFGRRLGGLVRGSDTVCRLGGDEFALLLPDVAVAADVEALCERILEAVRKPFRVLGSNAHVGVSIGIVFAPEAGTDRNELLRKADIALYRAKDEGRDRYRLFRPEMDATVRLRSSVEEDLRRALDEGGELAVHYQPQFSASGNAMVGVEALVRWHHPTRGLISPEQFIPIAETTGLITRLGEWVVRQACIASRRWPDLVMAVNLSPMQFRAADFYDRLMAIVDETGADSGRLQLEVTEGVLLDDDELVRTTLMRLRAAGFTVALDDFGTGYSSLSYLRKFEVDKIKIDRSFIHALGQTVDSAAIVTAVLALARAMKLSVTAEGVETQEQLRFLQSAGCNELQGFLFAPALTADNLDAMLSGRPFVAAA
ncbi:putative bifunctional diguanylate cyclase/phosphodiesterase [Sphingosinicella terrae]|uniref:putative bifunctional diguanylate cyclase/phosphodiesterase n=1 Tax=Sphingosinicella terrae TaxID=2172047 RepID=UPI000E0DEB09|nr:EAL domain-containing protein [Sphingosinicella terrae]